MERIGGCVLEAFKFNNKVILCHVRVKPRLVKYHYGVEHSTHRWMHTEDWAKFDARLNRFVEAEADLFNKEKMKEKLINLNALIVVRISKSSIPTRRLRHILREINFGDRTHSSVVLECNIEYKEDESIWCDSDFNNVNDLNTAFKENIDEYDPQTETNSLNAFIEYTPSPKINTNGKSSILEDHEAYLPQPIKEIKDDQLKVPKYSPSSIGKQSEKTSFSTCKLDNSAKNNTAVKNSTTQMYSKLLNIENVKHANLISTDSGGHQSIQQSTTNDNYGDRSEQNMKKSPTKLSDDKFLILDSSQESKKKLKSDQAIMTELEKKDLKCNRHHAKSEVSKKDHSEATVYMDANLLIESMNQSGVQSKSDIRTPKREKGTEDNNQKLTAKTNPKILTTDHYEPLSFIKTQQQQEVNFKESSTEEIRRSSRKPHKPKRYIEDNIKDFKSTKCKQKRKKLFEDIFGSDVNNDEDNHNAAASNNIESVMHTPNGKSTQKLCTINEESYKKKRRHEKNSHDCAQEKRSLNNWLEKKEHKKSPSKTVNITTKNGHHNNENLKSIHKDSTSSTPVAQQSMQAHPTAEEFETRIRKEKIQIEYNVKLKKMLDDMVGPPPEKVETLTLHNMSTENILSSFETHKAMLDAIFNKLKDNLTVRGHNGINHCFVIQLVDDKNQFEMLTKLGDVYDKDQGSVTDTSLLTNALLPEWIIAIYMDKYGFTRDEAIHQIKAQEAYELHVEDSSKAGISSVS